MIFERKPKPGVLPDGAMRKGVFSFGGEFGGTGSVAAMRGVAYVQEAVRRLLAIFGATEESLPDSTGEPDPEVLHVFGPKAYVYAPEPGVFVPATELRRAGQGRANSVVRCFFPKIRAALQFRCSFEGDGDRCLPETSGTRGEGRLRGASCRAASKPLVGNGSPNPLFRSISPTGSSTRSTNAV